MKISIHNEYIRIVIKMVLNNNNNKKRHVESMTMDSSPFSVKPIFIYNKFILCVHFSMSPSHFPCDDNYLFFLFPLQLKSITFIVVGCANVIWNVKCVHCFVKIATAYFLLSKIVKSHSVSAIQCSTFHFKWMSTNVFSFYWFCRSTMELFWYLS